MEVCKNKSSGKYFLLAEDQGDKCLFITPLGETKLLDSNLFEEPFDIGKEVLLSQKLISDFQMEKGLELKKEKIIQTRTLEKNSRADSHRDTRMIIFLFGVNKAFLGYSNHPITIPRQYYNDLVKEIYGGIWKKDQRVTVIPPIGKKLEGHIYYGVAGYGPYYQIKVLGNYPSDYFGHLKHGEKVLVCIGKVDQEVTVWVGSFEKLS